MDRPTLEILPPEILHGICSALLQDDKPSVAAFSLTSRRIHAFAAAALFRTLTSVVASSVPKNPDTTQLWTTRQASSLPNLLRTVLTNKEIASYVREINFDTPQNSITIFVTRNDDRILRTAADGVGLSLPARLSGREAMQCMTEILAINTPNLRCLRFSCSIIHYGLKPPMAQMKPSTGRMLPPMQIIRAAAIAAEGHPPLLPSLVDVRIRDVGSVECIRPLSKLSPNISTLHLHRVCGHIVDVWFANVKCLQLTDADFTAREFKDLIGGFPVLERLRLQYFSIDWEDRQRLVVNPQQVIEALKPVATRMRELRLRFARWQQRHRDINLLDQQSTDHPAPAGLLTSLETFKALEHLDVDGSCLWATRYYEKQETNQAKVNSLLSMLPQGLLKLEFEGLRDDIDDLDDDDEDGLLILARQVKQRCPELQQVTYCSSLSENVVEGRLPALMRAFSAEGIAFRFLEWSARVGFSE
ncbi:uncharacterized protein CTRU02_200538 [Colletotrichum truncatum]|uniref:Uncharacterized protein n=1 Tax=Colletotrichum truncatum TaxID=5467 RepID=A0ACC3ZFH2_COLTU|nr:uncharacterized protein CTRU02_00300 [Colletotrichum truncatum]KAF6801551.1 hypothetical protein CTRU02_00300 [Colletotrichum truncatum]